MVHKNLPAAFTIDWTDGFLLKSFASPNYHFIYAFSQLKSSSDDGNSTLKLEFVDPPGTRELVEQVNFRYNLKRVLSKVPELINLRASFCPSSSANFPISRELSIKRTSLNQTLRSAFSQSTWIQLLIIDKHSKPRKGFENFEGSFLPMEPSLSSSLGIQDPCQLQRNFSDEDSKRNVDHVHRIVKGGLEKFRLASQSILYSTKLKCLLFPRRTRWLDRLIEPFFSFQVLICPKLQDLLFYMHAFLTAKVASLDPVFLSRGRLSWCNGDSKSSKSCSHNSKSCLKAFYKVPEERAMNYYYNYYKLSDLYFSFHIISTTYFMFRYCHPLNTYCNGVHLNHW